MRICANRPRTVTAVLLILTAAAGCAPQGAAPPAGLSVDEYDRYRERELRGTGAPSTRSATDGTAAPSAGDAGASPAPDIEAAPGGNPGLSDEQSFEAVTARESIESDRARLEAQREEYVFIEPRPVPRRSSANPGPNIVEYALQSSNAVGEQVYRRFNPLGGAGNQRACAQFPSPDRAQEAFLAAGGPERDPKNLDPDGDGFACRWDPAPFRGAG